MSIMNRTENVKEQFSSDKNLSTRINFYTKYATNPQQFTDWLFEKYDISEGDSILELGCGNGSHWDGKIERLPKLCKLVLSDFSAGMTNAARERHATFRNIDFQDIDIQSIPFGDESFDVVIANHMLMHVPNLDKGISEVRRVLRPDGQFYSATDGNDGLRPYIHNAIKQFDPKTKAFTEKVPFSLQNGKEFLDHHFSAIKRLDFENSLAITNTQDLIDWLRSTVLISGYTEEHLVELYDYFENIRKTEGTIRIPKETGLFISSGKVAKNDKEVL